jgi:uncharacterized lipoprotein YajG
MPLKCVERRYAVRSVVAIVAVATMLAGCSALKSGNSPTEAARIIDAVPGLARASIDRREVDGTFGSKNIVVVSATASRDVSTDPAALAEYLIEVGYSVNEWEPSSGLQVVVNEYRGEALAEALTNDGVDGVVKGTTAPGEFFVTAGVLRSKYGKWPGATPARLTPAEPTLQSETTLQMLGDGAP